MRKSFQDYKSSTSLDELNKDTMPIDSGLEEYLKLLGIVEYLKLVEIV